MAYEAGGAAGSFDGRPSAAKTTQAKITPKGVVTRKSTDVLAVENPDVASALGWVNRAQKLLETTGLTMVDIAAQSGFASLNHFFRYIQKNFSKQNLSVLVRCLAQSSPAPAGTRLSGRPSAHHPSCNPSDK
jgi:hypothetical protein